MRLMCVLPVVLAGVATGGSLAGWAQTVAPDQGAGSGAGSPVGSSGSSSGTAGVVTISFNSAVLESAEAQRQMKALDTKYAPLQAKLKALNDELVEMQKQLNASGDKLSDAERASRAQAMAVKQKQLERDSEDYKTDSQADTQQIFQVVAQKVFAFLQTYAQRRGYGMVVERGTDAQPMVWYAAGPLDITEELVRAYDAQGGAAAGAKSESGKPGTETALPAAPTPAPQ